MFCPICDGRKKFDRPKKDTQEGWRRSEPKTSLKLMKTNSTIFSSDFHLIIIKV
jgi:hypothetical protein